MSESFNQREVIDAIKEIAVKFNMSEQVISKIVKSQFEFVKDEMSKGNKEDKSTYSSILLKYFGTFAFNERRFDKIKDNIKKSEERKRAVQSEE